MLGPGTGFGGTSGTSDVVANEIQSDHGEKPSNVGSGSWKAGM